MALQNVLKLFLILDIQFYKYCTKHIIKINNCIDQRAKVYFKKLPDLFLDNFTIEA